MHRKSRRPSLNKLRRRIGPNGRLGNSTRLIERLEPRQLLDASFPELISRGAFTNDFDGDQNEPAISANGRYVVFASTAMNLVANDVNGH
jgi:hypothetical protein